MIHGEFIIVERERKGEDKSSTGNRKIFKPTLESEAEAPREHRFVMATSRAEKVVTMSEAFIIQ